MGGLINSGAPDRVWFGCFCAFLPGLKSGEIGQVGAGRGAGCYAAVTGLAGDGIGADFGHGWLRVVVVGCPRVAEGGVCQGLTL